MAYKTNKKDKSQVEFTITVTPEEYQPALEKAAARLSERASIKGFRKGKAPYDVVKQNVGEMAIMQEAIERIVQEHYVAAVQAEELAIVGMPEIKMDKMAPGNDVVFSATVALLPDVKLPDLKKIKVKREEKKVDDKQIDETIDALRGMHANEVAKEGKAEGTDKLLIDMDMFIDKVPVDGGQAKDYQVYLSEDHYIPGFNKEVEGLKKGDTKEFTLDFPKTHYQKNLAGKTVEFKVSVKDVFERQMPEVNEDFAKKLGQKSVDELKELIKSNLTNEAKQKADQKFEIDMLDAIIEKAKFSDLPEVLINAERQKIFYELKGNLERSGISVEQYLRDIKKTEEDLRNDFTEQATKRAKAALISREVAQEQKMEISDKEIDAEIELMKGAYAHNKEAQENLKRPEIRDSIAVMLQNKKVITFLKETIEGNKK